MLHRFESQTVESSLSPRKLPRVYATAARRFLVIAAIAFWLGGFTFYSGVAIPMGVEVLGTHRAVGFITERVTNWLNVAGVVALIIFLWNLLLEWRGQTRHGFGDSVTHPSPGTPGEGEEGASTMSRPRRGGAAILRWTLLATWIAMATIEIELIALHPAMDHLLRTGPRQITNQDRFDLLHHVYLISTTVQWMFGVVHVWCVAVAWSQVQ